MRALYAQVITIRYLDCKRHEMLLYYNTYYNLLSCFLLLCFFIIENDDCKNWIDEKPFEDEVVDTKTES
jgi:hypothetical protein